MEEKLYDNTFGEGVAQAGPNWQARRIIAFALPTVVELAAAGAIVLGLIKFRPLDMWHLVLESLKIGLPLLAFGIWVSVKLLKGRPTLFPMLIIAIMLSLTAYPAAGAGFEILFNGLLDKSVASNYQVEIIEKYSKRSNNTTDYYVKFASWRGDCLEELNVSGSEFEKIRPQKSSMTVTTKPGRFGHEWLVGYQINPS